MAEDRDDPKWVADRLKALDQLFEDASGRVQQVGFGAAAQVVPDPDTKGAVAASQHAAELRGLLGAAKRAPLERGKGEGAEELPDDPAELIRLHEERIAKLRLLLPTAGKTEGKDARH